MDKTSAEPPSTRPLVNLLGILPQQDVFWQGHLLQISQLLAELGFEANPLFGLGQGVEAWRRLPQAAVNLVLSPWGRNAAGLLHTQYGTPQVELAGLPVGPTGVARLVEALKPFAVAESAAVLARHEAEFDYFLNAVAPRYFAAGFQREFAIVGDTALVTGLTDFLVHTLGLIPRLAILTDPFQDEGQAAELAGVATLREWLAPFHASVHFSEDAAEIADLLREARPELILASSLEQPVAEELAVPLLPVSFPVASRLILRRGYAGYDGALALIEDLGGVLLP